MTANSLRILLATLFALLTPAVAEAQRIKDLGRVEGVRDVYLKGPGLVIGLPGTGDSARSAITREFYGAFFERMGIDIPEEEIRSRNVALVMVTARVPSTTKVGSSIEVSVSSIGDAKSIKGGWLLETALGLPGRGVQGGDVALLKAVAQGAVTVRGTAETVGEGIGYLEGDISFDFVPQEDAFTIILNQPDFTSASLVARAINDFPYLRYVAKDDLPLAHALDSGSIKVVIPKRFRGRRDVVDFISRIMGEVQIPFADSEATVVIDSATQIVTVNGRVRVSKVVVLHGDAKISIPPAGAPATEEEPYLVDVMEQLGAQGVPTKEMPAIIRNIHRAGALIGKLVEQ